MKKIITPKSFLVGAALLTVGLAFVVVLTPSVETHAQTSVHEHTGDVLYQCPMHPQITSDGPGNCPLCNMFLKKKPAADVKAKVAAWEKKTGKKAPPVIKAPPPGAASQPAAAKKPSAAKPATKNAPMKMPVPEKTAPAATKSAPKGKPALDTTTTKASGDYTCPMHTHVKGEQGGRCPVCGMNLVPRDEVDAHAEHQSDHATYTCPMHPQITSDEAGRCPICGMNLELKDGAGAPGNQSATGEKKERKIKHWVAPMDPTFISDKPGKSPMGMDLVPVYEDDGQGGSTVKIDPVVVQNMGVRIARATRQPMFRHIRALGTVDVAEDEVAVVNLRFSGWIETLYVDETGVKVRRGQALAEVYSPELVSAQEEYLLALRTRGPGSPLAESAKRRLLFFGMNAPDIKKIDETRTTLRTIRIRAPREGYVLHKDVVQGARVMAGHDIFRIGNLKKIWINAEVYEYDAPWVELDAPATMEITFEQGKTYSGKVAYIYPTLNQKTRTLTVRLEFDNPGLALKPGMFATVRIESRRRDGALAIPTESILHSGEREIVFVALGNGRYDKREITTGLVGDRYLTEVVDGLREGERVVVSGQFLLDSESQLQEAVQKLLDARLESKDPGAKVGSGDDASASSGGGGDSYWTCSMHPQIVQDEEGTCPICGMNLVQRKR